MRKDRNEGEEVHFEQLAELVEVSRGGGEVGDGGEGVEGAGVDCVRAGGREGGLERGEKGEKGEEKKKDGRMRPSRRPKDWMATSIAACTHRCRVSYLLIQSKRAKRTWLSSSFVTSPWTTNSTPGYLLANAVSSGVSDRWRDTTLLPCWRRISRVARPRPADPPLRGRGRRRGSAGEERERDGKERTGE